MTHYNNGRAFEYREIPLTDGIAILVDAADYQRVVSVGRWTATRRARTSYAVHQENGRLIYLHTFLTGWPFVDHQNGNGLDNRRANLRPADKSKNAANSRMRSDNTTGCRGVSRHSGRWVAQITCRGEHHYLGMFSDPESAARAYDAAARERFGEFARSNFPGVDS